VNSLKKKRNCNPAKESKHEQKEIKLGSLHNSNYVKEIFRAQKEISYAVKENSKEFLLKSRQ